MTELYYVNDYQDDSKNLHYSLNLDIQKKSSIVTRALKICINEFTLLCELCGEKVRILPINMICFILKSVLTNIRYCSKSAVLTQLSLHRRSEQRVVRHRAAASSSSSSSFEQLSFSFLSRSVGRKLSSAALFLSFLISWVSFLPLWLFVLDPGTLKRLLLLLLWWSWE